MGASGNIGSKITKTLLDKGEEVRVLGRSIERLQKFIDRDAEALTGDAFDSSFLTAAFQDSKAIYAMTPRDNTINNLRACDNKIGESIANAIKESGVKYVVNLSSLSAYRPDKTGPVKGLYDQEQRLNKLKDINIIHLRPAYFMDNFLRYIDMIKNKGVIATAFKGDIKFPMVFTKDIADEATGHLLKLDFSGKVVKELRGERDLSFNEATKIIGEKIAKPELTYVQLSYEDAEKGLTAAGMSTEVSRLMLELIKSTNEGIIGKHSPRTKDNTTPTSFEEFADQFVKVYMQSTN